MKNNHLIKLLITIVLFCVFLVIIDISTTVILHNRENTNSNRIKHNSEKIVEAEFRTCERLNTLRHSDNVAHWVQWLQLQQSIKRSAKLAETEPNTKIIRLKGNEESEKLARKITWTPLTDCNGAVRHPYSYVPPRPEKFGKNNLQSPPVDSAT